MSDAFFFHIVSKNVKLSGVMGIFGFCFSLAKFQKSSAKIKKENVIVRRKYTVKIGGVILPILFFCNRFMTFSFDSELFHHGGKSRVFEQYCDALLIFY